MKMPACGLLLLLALSGCASATSATSIGPHDEWALPIDAYALSAPEVDLIGHARDLLIGRCMHRLGFPFDEDAVRAAYAVPGPDATNSGRRYGVTDLPTATKYGYHLPPARQAAHHGLGDPTPEKSKALAGKCIPEAEVALAGNQPMREADLVSLISRESFQRALTDPTVTTALAAWATCMKAAGHDYPSPDQAAARFDLDASTISPEEVATAQTDVTCRQQTNLTQAWRNAETAYQTTQIPPHLKELQSIRADHDAQIRRAQRVIADRP